MVERSGRFESYPNTSAMYLQCCAISRRLVLEHLSTWLWRHIQFCMSDSRAYSIGKAREAHLMSVAGLAVLRAEATNGFGWNQSGVSADAQVVERLDRVVEWEEGAPARMGPMQLKSSEDWPRAANLC